MVKTIRVSVGTPNPPHPHGANVPSTNRSTPTRRKLGPVGRAGPTHHFAGCDGRPDPERGEPHDFGRGRMLALVQLPRALDIPLEGPAVLGGGLQYDR